MKYLMITGRTVNQGVTVENKTSVEYAEETSTCFMHGFDMLELGLDDGGRHQGYRAMRCSRHAGGGVG